MHTTTPKKVAGPDFRYVRPAKRRPTQYEEVTLHTQWDPKNFAKQGWFSPSSAGRPMWDERSSRLRATDWWAYRDPAQQWFRPYIDLQAKQEDAIELTVEGAKRTGLLTEFTPQWKEMLANYYAAYRYLEYGFFLCFCYVQREALSDVVACPLVFQGLDKDRHAQAIALYGMDLEEALPGWSDANAQPVWMTDPIYQPSREYVERLLACRDWGEITLASNLIFEPLVTTLFTREFLTRFAAHHGDAVTPVILETVDADRRRNVAATAELVRFLLTDTPANRPVIEEWLQLWTPRAVRAAHAFAPLFTRTEEQPLTFATAWQRVTREYTTLLKELGLSVSQEVQS
uniref:Putative propane monooxygenase beta subunit n=1 Tax=uncultured bacterium UPO45 TaxID=1776970 RepID=A0A126SY20_9BACT|nr:putative propane monooxygenase beta subunit [uncultured bacterium UPO45]